MKYAARTNVGVPGVGLITRGEVLSDEAARLIGAERLERMAEDGTLERLQASPAPARKTGPAEAAKAVPATEKAAAPAEAAAADAGGTKKRPAKGRRVKQPEPEEDDWEEPGEVARMTLNLEETVVEAPAKTKKKGGARK